MLKKSVVIRAKRLKPLKIDYKMLIFFTLIVCGIILGISLIKNGENDFNSFIKNLIESINLTKRNSSFFSCILFVAGWLLLFEIIVISGGLSGVGISIIVLVCIIYCIICGVFCGGYYINYGIEGIGFFGLIHLPCYAITAATLIKCCCESISISLNIFSYLSGGNKSSAKTRNIIKDYLLYNLILSLPLFAGAILNVTAFKILSGLFSSIIVS